MPVWLIGIAVPEQVWHQQPILRRQRVGDARPVPRARREPVHQRYPWPTAREPTEKLDAAARARTEPHALPPGKPGVEIDHTRVRPPHADSPDAPGPWW